MRARTLPLAALACAGMAAPGVAQSKNIVLATTTSTRDAGLLDVLLPVFERQTGYTVKVVAVGSGEALELGRRGEADLVLAHAPQAERVLADSGYFVHRRLVMHNEFLIVGPPGDPDSLRGVTDAAAAFHRMWERHGPFVSRGDESGTHKREKILWKAAGLEPPLHQSWYLQSGQGMGATLHIASERQAYTLTDIATYLTQRKSLELDLMVQGDPALNNVYHDGAQSQERAAHQPRGRQGAGGFLRCARHPEADRRVRHVPVRPRPVRPGRRQAGSLVAPPMTAPSRCCLGTTVEHTLAPVPILRRSAAVAQRITVSRSEERRVGKECRSRWSPYH